MDTTPRGPTSTEVIDAARLCTALYDSMPEADGWRPLSVAALGLSDSFADQAERFVNRNAAAFVRETVVGGERTLALVFRGSNPTQPSDWLDNILDINRHYRLMRPLIEAVRAYVRREGISRVLVAGHSLGGAMVELFMHEHPDEAEVTYAGCAFGSPGARLPANTPQDTRLIGIRHKEDAIPWLASIRPWPRYTTLARELELDDLGRHENLIGPMVSHKMLEYLDTVRFLDQAGLLDNALAAPGCSKLEFDSRANAPAPS